MDPLRLFVLLAFLHSTERELRAEAERELRRDDFLGYFGYQAMAKGVALALESIEDAQERSSVVGEPHLEVLIGGQG